MRVYREKLISESRLTPLFPLWKIDSGILIQDFIDAGFKTLICAANANYFNEAMLGKTIDRQFLNDLNKVVDPCGENGEFHTFVYDGPIFKEPLKFTLGEVVSKKYTYQQQNTDGSLTSLETNFLFQDLRLPLD